MHSSDLEVQSLISSCHHLAGLPLSLRVLYNSALFVVCTDHVV